MTDLVKADRPDLAAMTLNELAAEANAQHARVLAAASEMFRHAIAVGAALEAIRDKTLAGNWGKWCEDNLDFTRVTANVYRRIFYYRDCLSETEGLSIAQAVEQLRGKPRIDSGPVYRGLPTEQATREEIADLHAAGLTLTELAAIYGRDRGTIRRWVNPEYRRKDNERLRMRRAEKRLEKRRQLESRIGRTIAKRKDPVSDAYSMIRKLTQVVDQGKAEVQDREGKEALRRAEDLLHQADAAIVKALGLK
jgi:hypothetical protein